MCCGRMGISGFQPLEIGNSPPPLGQPKRLAEYMRSSATENMSSGTEMQNNGLKPKRMFFLAHSTVLRKVAGSWSDGRVSGCSGARVASLWLLRCVWDVAQGGKIQGPHLHLEQQGGGKCVPSLEGHSGMAIPPIPLYPTGQYLVIWQLLAAKGDWEVYSLIFIF